MINDLLIVLMWFIGMFIISLIPSSAVIFLMVMAENSDKERKDKYGY